MARPTKSPEERRDSRLAVMLTVGERAELEDRAAAIGLSVSEFVRRRTLGIPLPPQAADRVVRDKLATALLRVGVNLNQIAKHMNAGRTAPPYLPDLLSDIRNHVHQLTDEPDRDRQRAVV